MKVTELRISVTWNGSTQESNNFWQIWVMHMTQDKNQKMSLIQKFYLRFQSPCFTTLKHFCCIHQRFCFMMRKLSHINLFSEFSFYLLALTDTYFFRTAFSFHKWRLLMLSHPSQGQLSPGGLFSFCMLKEKVCQKLHYLAQQMPTLSKSSSNSSLSSLKLKFIPFSYTGNSSLSCQGL